MVVFAEDYPLVSNLLKIGKRENPLFRFYLCPQSIKALNELYGVQPMAVIGWMYVLSKVHLMTFKKIHNFKGTVNNIFIVMPFQTYYLLAYTCYTAIDCRSSAGAKWI